MGRDFEFHVLEKVAKVRDHVRNTFGQVAMAMMALPRYRHQSLSDLNHLILEPLIRDRIAVAHPAKTDDNPYPDLAGLAIWASVSDEVDAKIREQIKAGSFPIRLKADDWTSGSNNWLLDVIAPNAKATASVIANLKQVVKDGDLRIHPIITRLVEKDVLETMGAKQAGGDKGDG
ncbi:MAG: toxin-activating lysine-acyltransferase [Pseudomonadota bacterium]